MYTETGLRGCFEFFPVRACCGRNSARSAWSPESHSHSSFATMRVRARWRRAGALSMLAVVALLVARNFMSIHRVTVGPELQRSLVVFSAVGRPTSVPLVAYNARQHFPAEEWDCIVLAYALEDSLKEALPPHCVVELHAGFHFGDFINHLVVEQAVEGQVRYQYVALILDDVLLDARTFSVDAVRRFMRRHRLAVASPALDGVGQRWGSLSANEVWRGRREDFAAERPQSLRSRRRAEGRIVNVVEIFATFYTADAWGCLSELFWEGNHFFHGYDSCYYPHCKGRGLGRMGVLDDILAFHTEKAVPRETPPGMQALPALSPKAEKDMRRKWDEKRRFFEHVHSAHSTECLKASRSIEWLYDDA